MSFFSKSGLTASRAREKMIVCPICGVPIMAVDPEKGYCCPLNHGCWWPDGQQRDPPEELKARCYYKGQSEYKSQGKGRKRKKKPKKPSFSELFLE